MRRFIVALVLLMFLSRLAVPSALAQNERLVLAFYYAWFDQNSWSPAQLSDQPAQFYDSRDRVTIQRHVAQAQSAGIDAFVQSWYGPSGGVNNMTESNFAMLLDVSASSGFRAAVDFEVTGPFFGSPGEVQSALAALLAGHARHPAYLKVNGKPVVFFWRQQRFSVDEWAAIRQQVDPNRASLWIAEGTDPSYLRVFDGIHWYSVAWSADPATSLVNYGARVRKTAHDLGGFRYWVAPVMPGYDDTKLRGAGGFARPRNNGEYYRATFAGAAQSGADWAIVTSFNEWPEGSMIEPSASYGDTYLNLTRDLAAAYRSGALAAPASVPAAQNLVSKQVASAPTATVTRPAASATATFAPTPTTMQTPSVTPSMTPSRTPSVAPSASPSTTLSATPSLTPLPTATSTAVPTEMPTPFLGIGAGASAWWVIGAAAALLLGMGLGMVAARPRP